jgi:nitroreductase
MHVDEAIAAAEIGAAFSPHVRAFFGRAAHPECRPAPQWHNVQPWKVYAVAGRRPAACARTFCRPRVTDAKRISPSTVLPHQWHEPYHGGRRRCRLRLYATLGIARDDGQRARSRCCATTVLRRAGGPAGHAGPAAETGSFMDLGMFIQNIMVAARGQDLHTCAQAAFAWYHKASCPAPALVGPRDAGLRHRARPRGHDPRPRTAFITEREPVEAFTSFRLRHRMNKGTVMAPPLRGRAGHRRLRHVAGRQGAGRSPLWLAADAARKALADAGWQDRRRRRAVLQRLRVAFPPLQRGAGEYLGITPTYSNTLQVSGATAATLFAIAAAAAVHSGLAETVLVVGADSLLSGLSPDGALRSMTESRDQQYEMPFGIPVANTFAMTAQRHMLDYGTTAEQFAQVAVVHREHARRTPGAQMTAPITVDDVLNSGWVSTPYHKLDCSLISDGGAAFVVMRTERAQALGNEATDPHPGLRRVLHARAHLPDAVADHTGAVQSGAEGACDGRHRRRRHRRGRCLRLLHRHRDHDAGGPGLLRQGRRRALRAGRATSPTAGASPSTPRRPAVVRALGHAGRAVPLPRGGAAAARRLWRTPGAGAQVGLVHSLGAGYATHATTILGTEATL